MLKQTKSISVEQIAKQISRLRIEQTDSRAGPDNWLGAIEDGHAVSSRIVSRPVKQTIRLCRMSPERQCPAPGDLMISRAEPLVGPYSRQAGPGQIHQPERL